MAANDSKHYVIIGNGIAGTTCAQMLRKNDLSCEIWLLTNEPYPLYNRVSLPRFLQGLLAEAEGDDPQSGVARGAAHLCSRDAGDAGGYRGRVVYLNQGGPLRYDALLIATGGWANKLRVPGVQGLSCIYNFVTLDDTKELIARALESKHAVTSGGSFIAYELTEGLNVRGVHVTWLMRGPYWLRTSSTQTVARWWTRSPRGMASRSCMARKFARSSRLTACPGRRGIVGQAVSRQHDWRWAGADAESRLSGGYGYRAPEGIVTNEYLETNMPGIFSAGDVAEFYDPMIDRHNDGHLGQRAGPRTRRGDEHGRRARAVPDVPPTPARSSTRTSR